MICPACTSRVCSRSDHIDTRALVRLTLPRPLRVVFFGGTGDNYPDMEGRDGKQHSKDNKALASFTQRAC